MKKQNIKEEEFEELLWENSKKYIKGEIDAKELKVTLSSIDSN